MTISDSVILRVVSYSPDYGRKGVAEPLAIILRAEPHIITPPRSQVVIAGSNAQLSVLASGARPLSYQWLTNGVPVAAATNQDLFLNNVLPAQAGAYQVVVSNAFGFTTSNYGRVHTGN